MRALRFFILTLLIFSSFSLSFAAEVVESSNAIEVSSEQSEASEAIAEVREIVIADIALPFQLSLNNSFLFSADANVWQSLLPDFGYFVDKEGAYTISQIAQAENSQFAPYSTFSFGSQQGLTWLYLLVPAFGLAPNEHIYIDLGDAVQGSSRIWFRETDGDLLLIPPLPQSANGHSYIVRDLAKGGELYVAIEGVPSLWFNPAIKVVASTSDIPDNGIYDSSAYKFYLLIALGILSLLVFVRFLTEKGEWRFWASIFGLATALLYYSGIPATPQGVIINSDLLPIFALSALLFSLVTLGRQMMALSQTAKGMNSLFLILSIVGVAIGFAPFSSSFAWLVRYIEFWPFCAIVLFVPTCMLALQGIRGSMSYLFILVCLFLGAAVGLYGVDSGLSVSMYSLAPLASCVLALLILLATPALAENRNISQENTPSSNYSPDMDYKASDTDEDSSALSMRVEQDGKEKKLSNEVVRKAIINESAHKEVEDSAEVYYDYTTSFENAQTFARIEQAFRVPLDSFMRELCFLEQQIDFIQGVENQNSKEKALVHTQTLLSVGKDINMLANSLPKMLLSKPTSNVSKIPFNIQDILRQVYEKVRYEAASSQIALSWFRSPHVGLWYVGDKNALATLLYQLLSDSIRATKQGIVYIRVERDEESNDFGRLCFTIGDSGMGNPPERRAASLLSKVWELTSMHNGTFKVESTENGTEYKFILELKALEDDGATEKPIPSLSSAENPIHNPKLLLITASEAFERHMLSFRLERMDFQILESMGLEECLQQYKSTPSAVVVLGADFEIEEVTQFILELRAFEENRALKKAHVVALYNDDAHEEELRNAGCTFTIESNARRITFRNLVSRLVNDELELAKSEIEESKILADNENDTQKAIVSSESSRDELIIGEEQKSKITRDKKVKEEKPGLKFALSLHGDDSEEEAAEEYEIKVNEEAKGVDPFYIDHEKEVDLPSFRKSTNEDDK